MVFTLAKLDLARLTVLASQGPLTTRLGMLLEFLACASPLALAKIALQDKSIHQATKLFTRFRSESASRSTQWTRHHHTRLLLMQSLDALIAKDVTTA